MRVLDMFPMQASPANAFRNVDQLSAREWTEAIEALEEMSEAYDAAHERALEEWNRRYSSSGLYESTGGLWTVNERGEFVRG